MGTKLVTLVCLLTVVSTEMAQSRERSDRSGGRSGGSIVSGHLLKNQIGIFPVSPGSRGFGLGLPRHRSRSLFHHHHGSVFRQRFGAMGYGVYGNSFFSWSWGYTDEPTDTDHFVEAWKDKDPFENRGSSGFSKSALLRKGMNEEEVIGAIGSPAEKIRLGPRETWQYSSYSLVFEGGTLRQTH